jgi:hypothetical protein
MFVSGLVSFVVLGSLSAIATAFPTTQTCFGVSKHAPVEVAWNAFVKLNDTGNDIFPKLGK